MVLYLLERIKVKLVNAINGNSDKKQEFIEAVSYSILNKDPTISAFLPLQTPTQATISAKTKQHSAILTATPVKEESEINEKNDKKN